MENPSYLEEIDVHKYWLVLRRRWLVVVGILAASTALSGFVLSTQRPQFEAVGQLLFQSNRTSAYTKIGENTGSLESLRHESNPLSTQAVVLQSRPILEQVIAKLNLRDHNGKLLDPDLLKIKVEPVMGTDVLKVSHISDNPNLAAAVVNQVMESYVESNIQSNRAEAQSAGKFIEQQLPRARAELEKSAEELRKFRTQNQIANLPEEAKTTVESIAKLTDELNSTQAELAQVTSQMGQLRSQMNISSEQAVDISTPGVQDAITELQKLQRQLANERSRYTEFHPKILNLKQEIAQVQGLIQQRVSAFSGTNVNTTPERLEVQGLREKLLNEYVQLQAQQAGLASRVQELSNLHRIYRQRTTIIPNLEKRQGDLERRLGVAQKTYEHLLSRLQEIRVAENQTVGNARIIQAAAPPPLPAKSKMSLLIGVGGVFSGLSLGIAAAFLIDLVDRSIKSVKEAESVFGYTLLGLIPRFDSPVSSNLSKELFAGVSPRVIVATTPRSVIHEAYQMLQANLKFISHKKVRTIVITSSVAGEGKSEVAANLATSIAQSGRRVLLVDADMRNPSQHHLWGRINPTGLSNILVGQDDMSKAVQTITGNLSVLTAGVIPPNPLALLDSEATMAIVETLSQDYDYVIFDTPPLQGNADAAILGKMVDGILFVVRPGVVDSARATAAKSLLQRSEANILGMVANGIRVKHEPDSDFYYASPREEVVVIRNS